MITAAEILAGRTGWEMFQAATKSKRTRRGDQ